MKISAPYQHAPVDPSPFAKNWTQNAVGTWVRMGNSAAAVRALALATQRCLARMPRPWFVKAWPISDCDVAGSDPLALWRVLDNVPNARGYHVRVLALPRTEQSGECYAGRTGGSATEETSRTTTAISSSVSGADVFEESYPVVRGAAADAEISEGISTFGGYTIIGVVVQDNELHQLNTDVHDFVTGQVKQGDTVLADVAEQIRSAFHALRTSNLPAWGWAARFSGGAPAAPVTPAATGIPVQSTSYVNLIDPTVSARTSTSPGSMHYVHYAGIGRYDQTPGQRIKLMCRVYGEVDGGASDGEVKFEGPTHVGSNETVISVTAGAGPAWYGNAANYIYLNGQSGPTDTGAARNKVDVFGRLATFPTNTFHVYNVRRWIEVS